MGAVSATLFFSQALQSLVEDPSMCQSSQQSQLLIQRWNKISGNGGKW